MNMVVGIIIGSISLVLIIGFLILLFIIYKEFLYTPKKGQNDEYNFKGIMRLLDKDELTSMINELKAIPYEDLYIKSFDGLKLHGYFYENKSSNQYVILFCGYRGSPRRDFCARAIDLIESGRNVILCDYRGHGLSEGHVITLGRKEQHDVVSWVNYIQDRFGKSIRVSVVGASLGATTVLLASDKLPSEVKVFADGGFTSQKAIVKQIVKRKNLNPNICWFLVCLSALIFGHVHLKDDAVINVKNSKCEFMIVHCLKDTIIPATLNKDLFEVNKEHTTLVFFENHQHAMAYFKEREKYKKLFFDFLDK